MSWRDQTDGLCDMCQVLYRDDGVPLGYVVRYKGASRTWAYVVYGTLREAEAAGAPTGQVHHLGPSASDEVARHAVEEARAGPLKPATIRVDPLFA
jgi:hypothetical protein